MHVVATNSQKRRINIWKQFLGGNKDIEEDDHSELSSIFFIVVPFVDLQIKSRLRFVFLLKSEPLETSTSKFKLPPTLLLRLQLDVFSFFLILKSLNLFFFPFLRKKMKIQVPFFVFMMIIYVGKREFITHSICQKPTTITIQNSTITFLTRIQELLLLAKSPTTSTATVSLV